MRCYITLLILALNAQPSFSRCWPQGKWEFECQTVGFDGRPLEEILQEQRGESEPLDRNYYELASNVTTLTIWRVNTNLTFSDDTFRNFTKLRSIGFYISTIYGGNYTISIPSAAFQDLTDLTKLTIDGFELTNETMRMLDSMKDRINVLIMKKLKAPGLLETISKFTNLTELRLTNLREICHPSTFPRSIFQKLVLTLNEISVSHCAPGKITKELFRGLRGLKNLRWISSNISEIENGAFDDLVNVEAISFEGNQIKALPNGLFRNNKKLQHLEFFYQRIDNLSEANFTHLEDPQGFRLSTGSREYRPFIEDIR